MSETPAVPVDTGTVVKLVIAWAFVGIPAIWGVWQVVEKSLTLFR